MRKLNYLSTLLLMWAGLLCVPMQAQITLPDLSPRCTYTQKVGFGEVTVDYSRPSMRGRVIFGDLVPYNELWRLGANEATAITFSEDVYIQEKKVDKGMYLMFAIPRKDQWTIIINKAYRLWGKYGYDENKDVMRFDIKPIKLPMHVETFTIEIGDISTNAANVMMSWENTMIKFKVGTDADARIVEEIDKRLKNPQLTLANTYYSAANYYLITHKDIEQAMDWIDMAIATKGERPGYLNLKAKIYAEMGDYDKAIQYARKSMAMAKQDDMMMLAEMNEILINKWKEKPNQ